MLFVVLEMILKSIETIVNHGSIKSVNEWRKHISDKSKFVSMKFLRMKKFQMQTVEYQLT